MHCSWWGVSLGDCDSRPGARRRRYTHPPPSKIDSARSARSESGSRRQTEALRVTTTVMPKRPTRKSKLRQKEILARSEPAHEPWKNNQLGGLAMATFCLPAIVVNLVLKTSQVLEAYVTSALKSKSRIPMMRSVTFLRHVEQDKTLGIASPGTFRHSSSRREFRRARCTPSSRNLRTYRLPERSLYSPCRDFVIWAFDPIDEPRKGYSGSRNPEAEYQDDHSSVRTTCEVGGDPEAVLRSDRHQLKRFLKPGKDPGKGNIGWFATGRRAL